VGFRLAGLRLALGATTIIVALVGAMGPWAPEASAQPVTGYAAWSEPTGSAASWTGSATIASVPGVPDASYATNSLSPVVPTGASTWLGASTPFGAVFGSSQGKPYLQARYTSGIQASTTTFTFAGSTPTQRGALGWGFALGDIDADSVTLSATTVSGVPATAAELGWQGAFNFCDVSPRPSGCSGGDDTDVPVWDPTTSTLTGNGSDTSGAAGWFRPTVQLDSLTLVFTPITGLPVFNLWMAATGGASVSGTVTCRVAEGVGPPIAGIEVGLRYNAELPVVVGGEPLTTTTDATGSYSFSDLAPGFYASYVENTVAGMLVGADAGDADATGVDAALPCPAPPPPSTSSTTSTTGPSTTTTSTSVPASTIVPPPDTGPVPPTRGSSPGAPTEGLPATGITGLGAVVEGSGSVAVGAALSLAARRRRGQGVNE